MSTRVKVTLAGNPNCGKTSIFNLLTGARQHVGNYPGVTVESRSGLFDLGDHQIELIDLPGIYSMSSNSPEEAVAFKELTRSGINLIINVIDCTILQRSLYLTSQLLELGIPMILVFNMSDEAERKGFEFNIDALEQQFNVPIVKAVGTESKGISHLKEHLLILMDDLEAGRIPAPNPFKYNMAVEAAISALIPKVDNAKQKRFRSVQSRFLAEKMLERDKVLISYPEFEELLPDLNGQLELLDARSCYKSSTFMADCRYNAIGELCRWNIRQTKKRKHTKTGCIDAVVTNRWLGLPIFLGIMYLIFWFTFTAAEPFMAWIEEGFALLGNTIGDHWSPEYMPFFRDLLIDGIISGVGGVVVFLPNIVFLFLSISLMEDLGYMSRAAFVMDGIMRRLGLQGRSFVPLILGFGCTVPAIMAARAIESRKDRTVTIMVLPLMSCGARLPIYALIIPAFFAPNVQPLVMLSMYLIGVFFALIGARLLKSTLFRGERDIFLMELPPYRVPTFRNVLLQVWERAKAYLHKAGTIILLTSIILYFCNNYPKLNHDAEDTAITANGDEVVTVESIEEMNLRLAQDMEYTISGRIGHFLEPAFRPIGFDWKMATSLIGALAAKEVFVSQLGIIYAAGDAEESAVPLRQKLAADYSRLQAFCIMLFCLLSIPCFATLAVIRRELNSWKMAIMEAVGLFALAYLATLLVYTIGNMIL